MSKSRAEMRATAIRYKQISNKTIETNILVIEDKLEKATKNRNN